MDQTNRLKSYLHVDEKTGIINMNRHANLPEATVINHILGDNWCLLHHKISIILDYFNKLHNKMDVVVAIVLVIQ